MIWCSSSALGGPILPRIQSTLCTVYLITIQMVPVLVWIRVFFHWSHPTTSYLGGGCIWCVYEARRAWSSGPAPSLLGLAIKVKGKGNSMFLADSDWWSRRFIRNCSPPHNNFCTWEMLIETLRVQRCAFQLFRSALHQQEFSMSTCKSDSRLSCLSDKWHKYVWQQANKTPSVRISTNI